MTIKQNLLFENRFHEVTGKILEFLLSLSRVPCYNRFDSRQSQDRQGCQYMSISFSFENFSLFLQVTPIKIHLQQFLLIGNECVNE